MGASCFKLTVALDQGVEHTLDKKFTHSQAQREGTHVDCSARGARWVPLRSFQRLHPVRIYSKHEFNGMNALFEGLTVAIPCWSRRVGWEVPVRSLTWVANSGKRVERLEPHQVPRFASALGCNFGNQIRRTAKPSNTYRRFNVLGMCFVFLTFMTS